MTLYSGQRNLVDCGADTFRVAMCRGPLMFIEKVNLFLLPSRSAHTHTDNLPIRISIFLLFAGTRWTCLWLEPKRFYQFYTHILSLPPVTYDSTFGCDSTLTEIIVRKSYLEYHQKICLFKSMKKIADGLDCGEDVLHVVMCRGPFLLLEQVSIYCRLHVIFKMF